MERSVLQQITELQGLSFKVLQDRWRTLFGTEPPASYKADTLVRRLAYRVQELHFGGLSQAAHRELEEVAARDEARRLKRGARKVLRGTPATGTRFVREWHGQEHIVTVTADGGYDYGGRRFRSLTAVAKEISGQHINGRRFFGLYRQEGKAAQ